MTALKPVASILRKHGWIQGRMHNSNGYCLLGAIDAAFDNPFQVVAVRSIIRERIGDYSSISAWNDNPHRTIEQVLAILED